MIHLEHLNLVVKDLPETLRFYQTAFPHWYVRAQGKGEWNNKKRHWLHFGDDYSYIAMSDHGEGENRDLEGHEVGLAHFAFETSDIDGLIKRIVDAGYTISSHGAEEPYRRNVYFIDPAGFEVEFVQYLSDDVSKRNMTQ